MQTDLAAVIHGTQINQITSVNALVNRAGRQLLLDLDPQETKRIAPISGTVFNGVWDYPVPADLKGNKVIDLYPQTQRYANDVWDQAYNQAFDIGKGEPWSGDMFTPLFNSGLKTIRINAPFFPAPITLDACDAVGNWVSSAGATAPVADNINFVSGGGSLNFNLSAGQSSGALTDTISAVNLSAQLNQSTLFINTYLPTPSAVTSVNLQWGSGSSDYYSATTSVNQQNVAFTAGWNLLAFPWLGAAVVGSPNPSSITYVKVTWNYNSTLQTAVRLDNVNSNLGAILMMEYYSKYLFSNSAGTFKETVTDPSDIVNLDVESCNLLFNLVAYYSAQQLQGLDAEFFDGNFFLQEYQRGLAAYKQIYKSEIQKPKSLYYKMTNVRQNLWGGRWGN